MAEHTPTPWEPSRYHFPNRDIVMRISEQDNDAYPGDRLICRLDGKHATTVNTDFICRAVNSFDDLLQACKVGLRFTKNTATADAMSITKGDCDDAKTAVKCLQELIAKAEGGE